MNRTFARSVALHMHYAEPASEMQDVREPSLAPLIAPRWPIWRLIVNGLVFVIGLSGSIAAGYVQLVVAS